MQHAASLLFFVRGHIERVRFYTTFFDVIKSDAGRASDFIQLYLVSPKKWSSVSRFFCSIY